ncbi:tryptophan-rich sensory protein [bacterium]|nr:tryptophan-rich sensory protein [bacterium]
MKKLIIFLCCLLPWFISNIIPLDYSYYKDLKLPFFAPPQSFFGIAWSIIYILTAITIYYVVTSYGKIKNIPKSYKIILIINYLLNQSYTLVFFGLKNNFLGIISSLGTFLSTLFLYEETSLINSKVSKLLFSYIALSLFGTILSIAIYLLNM